MKRVHAVYSLIGLAVGFIVAIYAYVETTSIALPIFAFFLTHAYIHRGLGDVATDPQKVKRFIYFTLLPVFSLGVLWLTYEWWGLMWLSAPLAFFIGTLLWGLVSSIVFPEIQREEREDTEKRRETGEP